MCKAKEMTQSEENYLKAVYHLEDSEAGTVNTNSIADYIHTKPSSVTDMVKKLAEKGLLNYKKYQGVSLTGRGTKKALSVIRKHRLWETFLVEKLNFAWDEVHEVAEQLEHIESEKLINELDRLLGFPKSDPHGDPIPDKNGELEKQHTHVLSVLPVNSSSICVGVRDTSVSFLNYLDKNKIALGDEIHILEKEVFDDSVHIQIGERTLHLSNRIASNLLMK